MHSVKSILLTVATCLSLSACGACEPHEQGEGAVSPAGELGSLYSVPPNVTSDHQGSIVFGITTRFGQRVPEEIWSVLRDSLSVKDEQGRTIGVVVNVVTMQPTPADGSSLTGPIPRVDVVPQDAWGSGWRVLSVRLPAGLGSNQLFVADGFAEFWFRADRGPILKRVSACERAGGGFTAETHFSEMIAVANREYLEGNVEVDGTPCELQWQLNDGDTLVDAGSVAELLYSCPQMRPDSSVVVRFADAAFASDEDIPRLMSDNDTSIDLHFAVADAQVRGDCYDWVTVF